MANWRFSKQLSWQHIIDQNTIILFKAYIYIGIKFITLWYLFDNVIFNRTNTWKDINQVFNREKNPYKSHFAAKRWIIEIETIIHEPTRIDKKMILFRNLIHATRCKILFASFSFFLLCSTIYGLMQGE